MGVLVGGYSVINTFIKHILCAKQGERNGEPIGCSLGTSSLMGEGDNKTTRDLPIRLEHSVTAIQWKQRGSDGLAAFQTSRLHSLHHVILALLFMRLFSHPPAIQQVCFPSS